MATKKKEEQKLKPINRRRVTVRLVGVSPLIQHKWSEKAMNEMRDKQQLGKKTKTRGLKDPKEDGEAAMHRTPDGKPGVPAVAIKAAVINAAHVDLGIPKVLVRKALFILPFGRDVILPLEPPAMNGRKKEVKYEIVEDMVRVGQGTADMRYRPYFDEWAVTTTWEIDGDLLQTSDLLTLLDRAGFGVGLMEWRPQKEGEYGRFRVDQDFKVIEEQM